MGSVAGAIDISRSDSDAASALLGSQAVDTAMLGGRALHYLFDRDEFSGFKAIADQLSLYLIAHVTHTLAHKTPRMDVRFR